MSEEERRRARKLDEERLAQGGAVPRADALDTGESGAPMEGLDTESGSGPGAGARHEGGAGGAGARVGAMRDRGHDIAEDEEEPAAGGPGAGPKGD